MVKPQLPHTRFSARLDALLATTGRALGWIWLLLLLVIVINVILRYVFSEGRIELEELQWHLYSIGFLLGMSYAYQSDAHIRVDLVHERLSLKHQAWIELYGILLFLLPFIALVLIYGVPFVLASYRLDEISPSPGGLPYRWLIKAILPLGFVLLAIAVVSRLTRVWSFLFLQRTLGGGDADGS